MGATARARAGGMEEGGKWPPGASVSSGSRKQGSQRHHRKPHRFSAEEKSDRVTDVYETKMKLMNS